MLAVKIVEMANAWSSPHLVSLSAHTSSRLGCGRLVYQAACISIPTTDKLNKCRWTQTNSHAWYVTNENHKLTATRVDELCAPARPSAEPHNWQACQNELATQRSGLARSRTPRHLYFASACKWRARLKDRVDSNVGDCCQRRLFHRSSANEIIVSQRPCSCC